MKTQQDNPVRMVALENLHAMCDHISGTCHRYHVSKVTRSRVWVEYSNPNEYGTEHPISVVFPCIPSDWPGDEDNPRVFLETLRVVGGREEYDPIQFFNMLFDCPHLWRGPVTGAWKPEEKKPADA